MKTVDLHAHITWNVDDGIQTKEETIQALQMAKNDGITDIVLTPHFIPGRFKQSDFDEITEAINECIQEAKKFDIQAYSGCELFLNEDYLEMIDSKCFHSLNQTNYVLVEFDVRKEMNENNDAEEKLYELILRGYIPVIAHVERYFHGNIDLKRVQEWMNMGCVIQVNRTSLMRKKSMSNTNAIELIENNLVQIIATDTHSSSGNRICKMSDAYDFIKNEYGEHTADLLCRINAKHILNNEKVENTDIRIKKSLFSKILRRR